MNINENLLNRRTELYEMEPFKTYNIANVEAGDFQTKQLDLMCLEVINFEFVNGCFQAKFRDL